MSKKDGYFPRFHCLWKTVEGSDTEEVNEELDALEAAGIDISDLGIPFRGKRKNIFDDLCNFQWSCKLDLYKVFLQIAGDEKLRVI